MGMRRGQSIGRTQAFIAMFARGFYQAIGAGMTKWERLESEPGLRLSPNPGYTDTWRWGDTPLFSN